MRILFFVALTAALCALGIQLWRRAGRRGESPERILGLVFCLAGSCAWLMPVAASGIDPELARILVFTVQGVMSLAITGLGRFAWLVFRPTSRVAPWLALPLLAANLGALPLLILDGAPTPTGPLALAVMLPRCAVMGWLFAESARYARLMRRRLQLGLAEPVVANRFTLWAIWTGALALIPSFVLALRDAGVFAAPVPGEPLSAAWRAALAVMGLGFATALVAGWLSFFPTAGYRRWVERTPA